VLGAYSVQGTDLITITNDAYINSDTLVELLIAIHRKHPATAVTLVMDNARYQRCAKVMEQAQAFGIDLLFLPPYSPNFRFPDLGQRFG
jgi:transposase